MKDYNSLKELYEEFIKMERDLNLFSMKVNEVYFWERIRFNIFSMLAKSCLYGEKGKGVHTFIEQKGTIKSYLAKLKMLLYAAFNIRKNPFLCKKKDVVIFSSSRRKLGQNGKWWDIYTDYIVDELPWSHVSLEGDFEFKFYKPTQTKNLKYLTVIELLVKLKKIIKRKDLTLTYVERDQLSKIEEELLERFRFKIDLKTFVINILEKREYFLPLYVKLLKRIQPKVVLIVCSYGKENIIEACKLLKIPVIELQHGVITRYHVGYSFELENAKKRIFPDYLFTFGDYWNDTVQYPIPKEKVISVGFPYLEEQQKRLTKVIKTKRDQIVFISQKTIGHYLSKFAVELADIIDGKYKIVYKLHPSEEYNWDKNYPWLKNTKITVVGRLEKNLYELFAESYAQVGIYSTALFEGLAFGLKTFVIDFPGVEYMDNLIQKGTAIKVRSAEELIEKLDCSSPSQIDIEYYFKRDALKNIIRALKKIIVE